MRLLWEDRAWNDYLYWQTQDKKMLKRVNALIKDICRSDEAMTIATVLMELIVTSGTMNIK